MENLKKQALAQFLGTEIDEIEKSFGPSNFEVGGKDYTVLTDEEADSLASAYILDSLWSFNGSFIQAHSNLSNAAIKALGKAQEELCEDANDLVKGVIKDLDLFVNEAIRTDGRGHFISSYDGAEQEEEVDGTGFFIYRTN